MKKSSVIFLVMVVSLVASVAFAGPWKGWKGSGGWGPGTQYHRFYNPQTVETITGEVLSVDKITPMKGMNYGIAVTLKTEKETIQVHLGPGWYVERLDVKIDKGDKLEVKGSRTTIAGKPVIIAQEFKKGDAVFVLRDNNGYPVWSGWKR